MRKQHLYSTLFLTAILCAGCAKEFENALDESVSTAIELSSVSTDPMTKAVITGTSFSTEEAAAGIGLFLLDGEGKSYGANQGNVRYGPSDGKWTAESPLRVGGTPGTLVGYYPYGSAVTDITGISVESSVNGTDFLFATPVEVNSSNAKSVSLPLSHALARVSLVLKLDGSYVGNGSLSQISLFGDCVAASGTLNAKTGRISATASEFTAGTEQVITKSVSTTVECLVVPVANESGTHNLNIACTIDGKAYATTFSGNLATLTQGRQTTIELTVKNTSLTIDSTSIGAWGEGGSKTVTVGGKYNVKVVLAEDVTPHDILVEAYAEKDAVKILAFPQSKRLLDCTLSSAAELSTEPKADGVTAFTISNIGSDVTATIGYLNTVSILSNSPLLGTVSGGGVYHKGTTIVLTATANTGCFFIEWRDEDGNKLDWTNPQDITVTSDLKVTAVFGIDDALSGVFTVNDSGKKVMFSKGNLYCSGVQFNSNGTVQSMDNAHWGFEDCQYKSAPSTNGTRDNTHISHFLWCENAQNALALQYDNSWNNQTVFFADNIFTSSKTSIWSVLSRDEWTYLLNTDGITDGSARYQDQRFAKAKVHGVNGLLIFPDGYSLPDEYGVGISKINDIRAAFPSDDIPDGKDNRKWYEMEKAGVVFIPAAGERHGYPGDPFRATVTDVGTNVYLWSSSPCTEGADKGVKAYCMFFGSTFANPKMDKGRDYALAVRLVTRLN